MTRLATGALRRPPHGNKTRSGASSQEAACQLAVASRVAPWSRLVSRRPGELRKTQPRRLERPSRTRNPGTSTRTSKTLARRGTRRSPMLAHETSPVSGASVVGMTYGAHHGPGNMPAGIPGVPTASRREDRLRPKGRLRQQPAGDSAEENWSRAMKTKLHNGCLAKSRLAPTSAA
jgi:hypothetical protein